MTNLFHKIKTVNGVKKLKKISHSTILILEEAQKLNIEWEKIPYTDVFKLKYKNKTKYFHSQIPSETTSFATYCCNNKRVARNIIEGNNLSITKGYLIRHLDKKDYCLKLFEDLKKPLVIKPVNDSQGNNVYLNINNKEKYLELIQKIKDFNGKKKINLLVEEMFEGDEFRVLTTQNKILSVIKRIPPNVTGDGNSTIEELINNKNKNPIRKNVVTYSEISINDEVVKYLRKQNLNLESILKKDQKVFLRKHSPYDISNGGDTVDVTDQIHPSVKKIVKKIMNSIPGLSLAGIDYMTKDISKQQNIKNYKIIEINSSPSLDWNQYPLEGPKRNIAFEFLKIMFPNLKK